MMHTLKLFSTLVGILLAFSVFGQLTGNPEIQKKLDAFIEVTNARKYGEMCDLMYPKLFTYIDKQELVNMASAENNGLSQKLTNRRITSFSAPFEEGNEKFIRITFTTDIVVDIEQGGLYDSHKASIGIYEQLKSIYGEQNVKYNPDERRFTIFANKAMMAIQEDGKDWSLIEININQMELMEALFSENVINALVLVK